MPMTDTTTKIQARRDACLAELRGLWAEWAKAATSEELAEWGRYFGEQHGTTAGQLETIRTMRRRFPFHTPAIANMAGILREQYTEGARWTPKGPDTRWCVICVEHETKPRLVLQDCRFQSIQDQDTRDQGEVAQIMDRIREDHEQLYGGRWQVVKARNRFEARALLDPAYAEWYAKQLQAMRDLPDKKRPARVLAALAKCGKLKPKRTGPPERTK